MKITANRELLLEAAKSVAGAASPKSPALPELEGILIEADMDNQQLKLTATNLQMVIQRRLKEIRIEQEGSVVIRAGLFCNMLKLLGGDDVTISQLDKQAVCVESGSAGYTVPGLRPDCFPAPEIPFPGDTIKIVGLPSLLKRTLFAAADADQKFEYQGVKLSFGVDCTTAAATDISRLAYVEADQCADGSLDILIHKHALKALCQIIKPSDELYIGIAAKSVVMLKEDLLFSARLIEGVYRRLKQSRPRPAAFIRPLA